MRQALFNGVLMDAKRWMKGRKLVGSCPCCGARMFPVISKFVSHHWRHERNSGPCECKFRLTGLAAKRFMQMLIIQRKLELERNEKWAKLSEAYLTKGENVMAKKSVKKSEQVEVKDQGVNEVSVSKGWLFETIRSTNVKVNTSGTLLYQILNGADVSEKVGVDFVGVNFTAMKSLMNWFVQNREVLARGLNMIIQNPNNVNTVSWKSEVISCLSINGKPWNMQVSLYRYGNNREQTHVYFTINGVKSVFLRFVIMRNSLNWLFDIRKFAGMAKLTYTEVEYKVGVGVGEAYEIKSSKPNKETADEFADRVLAKPTVREALQALRNNVPIEDLNNNDPF